VDTYFLPDDFLSLSEALHEELGADTRFLHGQPKIARSGGLVFLRVASNVEQAKAAGLLGEVWLFTKVEEFE